MSNHEAFASIFSDVLPNTSGDSVVYEGIVRGSHSADIGVYNVNGEKYYLLHNYRHNASSAVTRLVDGVREAILAPAREIYVRDDDSGWQKVVTGDDLRAQVSTFIDQEFLDMVGEGKRRPRGVLMPDVVLEIAQQETLQQVA